MSPCKMTVMTNTKKPGKMFCDSLSKKQQNTQGYEQIVGNYIKL